MLAFIFAALMTIAISALLPAEGVWLLHGLNGSACRTTPTERIELAVFLGLRDGSSAC